MMRLTPLLLSLSLAACGSLPPGTLEALRTTDPATTDLTALHAAVDMPDALRPRPGSARLVVQLGGRGGAFGLEEDEAASRSARQALPIESGRQIMAFRLTAEGRAALDQFRQAPGARRMTIGVAAEACRAGPVAAGPLMVGSWVSTAQTGRFVPLARFDLRRLAGDGAIAALPDCVTPAAGPA